MTQNRPPPAILSLATALPAYRAAQADLAIKIADISGLNATQTRWLQKLYHNSRVEFRHSVLNTFSKEADDGQLFEHHKPLTTAQRNAIYKIEAPKLAYQAAFQAIERWNGTHSDITHIIYVSCTGVMAPGVQAYLQHQLQLNPHVNQIGLNMMGCFGAFKGLDLAMAYAQQNPKHRILLICCELCSLHLQADSDPEHQVGNALFADGAAACVVGCPAKNDQPLYLLHQTASYAIPNSADLMTWTVGDTGFMMGLKPEVPQYIEHHIADFVHRLLPSGYKITACLFPIHPGGKQILLSIQKALGITEQQLACSWQTLANCGNMSSATFLFVLEALKQQTTTSAPAVGLGFGPGLMVEGLLLELIA